MLGIPIAAAAGNANVPWLEAIERRLAVTTKMLGSMKAIKMTGLTDVMSNVIASLRSLEIVASRRHRIFTVLEAVTCEYSRFHEVMETQLTRSTLQHTHPMLSPPYGGLGSSFSLRDRTILRH